MNEFEYNYLVHHGILNQKWGHRNGPPYPLDKSDHSAAEKKTLSKSLSGKRHEEMYNRKSKNNSSNSEKERDFHLTDQQKKYIKIGATVAATALVTYGGYKISTNPKLRRLVGKGLDVVTRAPSIDDMLANSGPEIVRKPKLDNVGNSVKNIGSSSVTKIKELSKDSGLYKYLDNRNPTKDFNNCKDLSICNAISKITGKDVIAGHNTFEGDLHDMFSEKFHIETDKLGNSIVRKLHPKSTNGNEIREQMTQHLLKTCKDGDIGCLQVKYSEKAIADAKKRNHIINGHTINFLLENGGVTYGDSQSGYPMDAKDIFNKMDTSKEIQFVKITEELAKKILPYYA